MPVIQVVMEITEEAAKGLVSGDLIRHGGVIYNATGGAYEHLKDAKELPKVGEGAIDVAKQSSFNIGDIISKSVNLMSKNKVKTSLVISGALVIGGLVIYGVDKLIKNNEKSATIDVVSDSDFNDSLTRYMLAAKEGKLTLPIIVELKERLIKISESDDNTIVVIDVKQLQALIGYIENYTEDLAKANNYQITDKQRGSVTEDEIVNLTKYLIIQEDIFEKAS